MGGTYPALSLYTGYVPLQVGMALRGEERTEEHEEEDLEELVGVTEEVIKRDKDKQPYKLSDDWWLE